MSATIVMSFVYKIHIAGSDKMLAIADASIIGKTFSHEDVEIFVSNQFYGSEKCSAEEALQLARKATIINAMGNDVVSLFVKNNIIEDTHIINLGKILHAQVVKIL